MKTLILQILTWIASDPERTALAITVCLVAGWKAVPQEMRIRFERAHPRLVGAARVVVALAPDVLGAMRTALWGVVRGQPRTSISVAEPAPDRETMVPPAVVNTDGGTQ